MSVVQLWMCCYICNRYKTREMWFMKYISAWSVQKIPNCLLLFIISPVKLKRALCHPSLPYLACASAGIISFRITEMPAAQHAMLPSFPALIHQATQIFSPNPPFACTPIPLEFDNTIWRADWIPPPSNIIGLLVFCLQGSNKMSCFPFGPLMPLWASFLQISDVPQWNHCPGFKPACWSWDYGPTTGFPPKPCPPSVGKPRQGMIWRCLPLCCALSTFLSRSPTTTVTDCSQLLAPPRH